MTNKPNNIVKAPSFTQAATPIVLLVVLLAFAVVNFADNSSYGPNQIALLFSMGVAAVIGLHNGHTWLDIEKAIIHGISLSMGAILILLAVGALIGTWLLSGTVPTMIYYGLKILQPDWFYAAACIICGVVAMSIGSSWTTAATIGVALIGISQGLGLSSAITAGAVISGAYFGDKISPLSETTNLAPAVAGSELFAHIRYMLWTTFPSISIALLAFFILGFQTTSTASSDAISALNQQLAAQFNLGIMNLFPVVVLLVLAFKKVPAFPAVCIGAIVGALSACVFQQPLITKLAPNGADELTANIVVIWRAFFDGVMIETQNTNLNDLLSGGGMASMLNTVWLIMCALSFGAVLEHLGMLKKFVQSLLKAVHSVGSLITSTIVTCISTNILTADQYMSIVMPGRMFKEEYQRRNLHPVVLSRTLEDAGTITSPLIPWNTCGAYMYSVLLVNPLDYVFYCFFNLINPVIAMIYGFIGFKIKYLTNRK